MKIALLNDTHCGVRGDMIEMSNYQGRFYNEVFFPYLDEHDIKHIIHLGANYSFLNNRANLNLNLNYNGKQDDFFFAPPFFTQQTVSLKSFTLIDVAASYKFSERLTVYGRLENLLDDTYEEVLGFQGTGIAAYAGIKLNFSR